MIKKTLCLLCAVLIFATGVFAESRNWFFKPADHARPVMPPDGVPDPGDRVIYQGPDEKCVYLTFDAGYSNENVLSITQILKERKIPAAFFILKHMVTDHADLLAEWSEAGILVCNHTMTHPNLTRVSKEKMTEELTGLEDLYRETTGKELDKFFRPPEGAYNEEVLNTARDLGYTTVFWDCAYADWDNAHQMAPQDALELLLSRTHNGAVVLLHPTSATNAAIFSDYLDALCADGYRFGALAELCDA